MRSPETLTRDEGATIAYHKLTGAAPGIVFLGGFHSDMTGNKALYLEDYCRRRGQAFVRFDHFGHGASTLRYPFLLLTHFFTVATSDPSSLAISSKVCPLSRS